MYDFFNKSSDQSSSSAKNTKKHQRSSSDNTKFLKSSHKLTFQIPDESIASHIDLSKIPHPNFDVKKKYAGLQNNPDSNKNKSNNIDKSTNNNVNKIVNKTVASNNKVTDIIDGDTSKISESAKSNQKKNIVNTNGQNLTSIPRSLSENKQEYSGPYNNLHSGNSQRKGSRQVSNSSLSSSVYPNEMHSPILSSRDGSNNTLPDFSRQASSIYPPSTMNDIIHDTKNNAAYELKMSATIKRSDLLKKRRPPPLSLKVNTEPSPINEPSQLSNTKSAVETIKGSAGGMSAASTESEFSPLHIIPQAGTSLEDPKVSSGVIGGFTNPSNLRRPTEYSSTDSEFSTLNLMPIKNGPLSQEKQINPYKSVAFETSGMEYEPPSFQSDEYENDNKNISNSNNNNIHKHSRTLSSIEEITSALDNFQMEHEKSLNNIEDSYENPENTEATDDRTGHTFSFAKSSEDNNEIPLDINLTQDLENHKVEEINGPKVEHNDSSSDELLVTVKDLPKLENGETLNSYIAKLKKKTSQNKINENNTDGNLISNEFNDGAHSNILELIQPKSAHNKSETSSTSEIFYDAADNSYLKNIENKSEQIVKNNNDANIDRDDMNNKSVEDNVEIPSRVSAVSSNINNDVNFDSNRNEYSEDDLIGQLDNHSDNLNNSFDSYPKHFISIGVNENNKDINNGTEKLSETQTVSTESSTLPEDIIADDGIWHRYSTTTNFLNNADDLDDGQIIDDYENIDNSKNNSEDNAEDINSIIITPTDNKNFVNMDITLDRSDDTPNSNAESPVRPIRDFNLDDELDNNVTEIQHEESSTRSFDDLYPHSDDDDYNDDGNEEEINNSDNESNYDYEQVGYNYDDGFNIPYSSIQPQNNEENNLQNKDNLHNDDISTNNNSIYDDDVLEFSPKSPGSIDSIKEMAKTPDIFRHNSMCSKGLLEKMTGINLNGTPTGLGIGVREHLVVTNHELNSVEESDFHDTIDGDTDEETKNDINDKDYGAPIPDIESNILSGYVERSSIDSDPVSNQKIEEKEQSEEMATPNEMHQNIYDRREEPIVMPIQHSTVVTPAVPIQGISSSLKTRRPPPNYASTGRRGRGLSETTANPEMFINGITQQMKVSNSGNSNIENRIDQDSKVIKDKIDSSIIKNDDLNNKNDSKNHINDNTNNNTSNNEEDIESRKGEKCTYIESLRMNGKKTTIKSKPSIQVLPIAIRQNGTISHKKIPSQQLLRSVKSHKHVIVKPKTRMLANEIDNGELPDATMIHRGQKTRVPIHPDADVIAASEQFNKLAQRQSGELGRYNSVLSVRPHYGNGMKLFITNPDDDD